MDIQGRWAAQASEGPVELLLFCCFFFERLLHLAFVAVVRSNENPSLQSEDDVRCINVIVNSCSEILGDNLVKIGDVV